MTDRSLRLRRNAGFRRFWAASTISDFGTQIGAVAIVETITADEVRPIVDLDGRVRDGGPAPTSEIGLHLGVYLRFGSGAVVHTHAAAATAIGLVVDGYGTIHPTATEEPR